MAEVTQADREVAAQIYDLLGFGPCQHIIDGIEDDIGVVQIAARHRTEAVKPLVEALEECRRVLFERIPRIGPEGPDTEAEQREYDEIGGAWSMADAALRSAQS